MTTHLEKLDEAQRIAKKNMSPRFCRLTDLGKWATGTQYKGRPSWWDDSVPLWERGPCVTYPIVRIAAQSNVDLVLGESRAPKFTAHPGEDDGDEDGGLDEDESKNLDRFLSKYHRLSRFRSHCREAFAAGQTVGTSVAIHGIRDGIPFNELVPAAWCIPTFSRYPKVTQLEIRYPFIEEVKRADGRWEAVCKLYRRVIDDKSDTVFKPALATEDGREPSWTVDEKVPHGLGFCPVIWYPFMRGCQAHNVVDGEAIHLWITDEIQAHDIARSQWHRGALMSEPQVYEIGVDPGFNPTDAGRTALVPTTEHGGAPSASNPITGHFEAGPRSKGARKKGPSYVWQYPNPETKVDALTYPGDALKAQQDNCSDLRIKLQESLAVVFLDPENIKFAATTSGKALEAIKQKQIDRCGQYRDDLRDGFLLPTIDMQLRIARAKAEVLKVPGLKKALPVIEKLDGQVQAMDVVWGDWFDTDPAEQKTIIEMVKAALKDNPLIPLRVAVEKIAAIFGIENVDAVLKELETERAEAEARAAEQRKAEQEELHAIAGGLSGDRGRARGNRPGNAGGSGGPAPAPGAKPAPSP